MSLTSRHLTPSGDVGAIGSIGAGLMGGLLAGTRIGGLPGGLGLFLDDLRGQWT